MCKSELSTRNLGSCGQAVAVYPPFPSATRYSNCSIRPSPYLACDLFTKIQSASTIGSSSVSTDLFFLLISLMVSGFQSRPTPGNESNPVSNGSCSSETNRLKEFQLPWLHSNTNVTVDNGRHVMPECYAKNATEEN